METLQLTKEIFEIMQPSGKVYKANSLPAHTTASEVTWNNNDENYIITLDIKARTFSGHFYEFNEETQDWDDAGDVPMSAAQIADCIKSDNLLLIERA